MEILHSKYGKSFLLDAWSKPNAKCSFEVGQPRPELEWQQISIKPMLMIDDKALRKELDGYHWSYGGAMATPRCIDHIPGLYL